ncbi:unnamed protein product [Meloidogyne enterolobii]|uniref:Uncharacterized protein n=1 Tax=Meloidogyne enterolobii TaxID=390850 RepID=A0ACB0XWH0_MELEN
MFCLEKHFFKTFVLFLLIKNILTTNEHDRYVLKKVESVGIENVASEQIKKLIGEVLFVSEQTCKQAPNIFLNDMEKLRKKVFLELDKLEEGKLNIEKKNKLENKLGKSSENNNEVAHKNKLENKVSIENIKTSVDNVLNEAKIGCLVGLEGPATMFRSMTFEFDKNKEEWKHLLLVDYENEHFLEIKEILSNCQNYLNEELSSQTSIPSIPKNLLKYFEEAKDFNKFIFKPISELNEILKKIKEEETKITNTIAKAEISTDFISPLLGWKKDSMSKLKRITEAVKETRFEVVKELQKNEEYEKILRRYKCAHMYFWLNEATKVLHRNLFSFVSKLSEGFLFENEENAVKWLKSIKIAREIIPILEMLKIKINFSEENKLNEKEENKKRESTEIPETSNKTKEKQVVLENGHENISSVQENGKLDVCPTTQQWSIWRGKVRQVVQQTFKAFSNLNKLYKNGERIKIKHSMRSKATDERMSKIYKMLNRSDAFDLMIELIEELKDIKERN